MARAGPIARPRAYSGGDSGWRRWAPRRLYCPWEQSTAAGLVMNFSVVTVRVVLRYSWQPPTVSRVTPRLRFERKLQVVFFV